MTTPYIWVIGGSLVQSLAIQRAKEMGYRTLVTDLDPQCHAITHGLVDTFISLDTYDATSHATLAKELPFPIAAVLTYGADVGPTVSAVAQVLKLPAAKLESAKAARNKSVMRMMLRSALNQRHPSYWIFDVPPHFSSDATSAAYFKDVAKAWAKLAKSEKISPYPCVLKPTENSASRGVTLVKSEDAWPSAFATALEHNRGGRFLVAEEFVSGDEYATDWLIDDGGTPHFIMAVSRTFLPGALGIEFSCHAPWWPPRDAYDLVRRAAIAFDVRGPFKVDFTVSNQHGVLIGECATRQSGGLEHLYYQHITGIDPVSIALNYALGKPIDPSAFQPTTDLYGCHVAPIHRPGPISGWQNMEQARSISGVFDIVQRATTYINPLRSGADRPIFHLATGPTKEMAFASAMLSAATVKPIYDDANPEVWTSPTATSSTANMDLFGPEGLF